MVAVLAKSTAALQRSWNRDGLRIGGTLFSVPLGGSEVVLVEVAGAVGTCLLRHVGAVAVVAVLDPPARVLVVSAGVVVVAEEATAVLLVRADKVVIFLSARGGVLGVVRDVLVRASIRAIRRAT